MRSPSAEVCNAIYWPKAFQKACLIDDACSLVYKLNELTMSKMQIYWYNLYLPSGRVSIMPFFAIFYILRIRAGSQ